MKRIFETLYFRSTDFNISFLNRKADMNFTVNQCVTVEKADRIIQRVSLLLYLSKHISKMENKKDMFSSCTIYSTSSLIHSMNFKVNFFCEYQFRLQNYYTKKQFIYSISELCIKLTVIPQ